MIRLTILLTPLLCYPAEATSQQTPHVVALEVKPRAGRNDDAFLEIMGMAFTPDGGMIVADRLDYAIKKVDREGNCVASAGGRGTEPGRFRGPGPIDCFRERIAVADFATSRIQLFSTDLVYRHTFRAPGPVFDLHFDRNGSLWIGAYASLEERRLYKYAPDGTLVQTIIPRNATGDRFADIFCMTASPCGAIVLAYYTQNHIEIWDTTGVFLRECSVPGLLLRVPSRVVSRGLFSSVTAPEGKLIADVTTDAAGNIFVLGADYSAETNREVYVLDPTGRFLTSFSLPSPAESIRFGPDGKLYAVHQRTVLRQYKLQWHR